jgi:hypothetical protein
MGPLDLYGLCLLANPTTVFCRQCGMASRLRPVSPNPLVQGPEAPP